MYVYTGLYVTGRCEIGDGQLLGQAIKTLVRGLASLILYCYFIIQLFVGAVIRASCLSGQHADIGCTCRWRRLRRQLVANLLIEEPLLGIYRLAITGRCIACGETMFTNSRSRPDIQGVNCSRIDNKPDIL